MNDENVDEEQLYWLTLLGNLDSGLKDSTVVQNSVEYESQQAMQSYLYLDLVQYDDEITPEGKFGNKVEPTKASSTWLVGKEINDVHHLDGNNYTSNSPENGKSVNEMSRGEINNITPSNLKAVQGNKYETKPINDDFSAFQSRFLDNSKKKNNILYKTIDDGTSTPKDISSQMVSARRNSRQLADENSGIILTVPEELVDVDNNNVIENQASIWNDEYAKSLYNLMKEEMNAEGLQETNHSDNTITEEQQQLRPSQDTLCSKANDVSKAEFAVQIPQEVIAKNAQVNMSPWYNKMAEYLHNVKQNVSIFRNNDAPSGDKSETESKFSILDISTSWVGTEVRKYASMASQSILSRLNEHLYMHSLLAIVEEVSHNTVDRTTTFAEKYITLPVSLSNQEWKYFEKITNASSGWEQLFIRYSMATIHWKQRQLLKETRDDNYYQFLPRSGACDALNNPKDKLASLIAHNQQLMNNVGGGNQLNLVQHDATTDGELEDANDSSISLCLISSEEKESFFPTIKQLVELEVLQTDPSILSESNSNKIFEAIDENSSEDVVQAQLQCFLLKYFTPPPFQLANLCFICQVPFSVTCFRHHCRYCGGSVCSDHSRQKRRLFRFGIIPRVRVCDKCVDHIDERYFYDELLWKDGRLSAYMANELIPYTASSSSFGGWEDGDSNGIFSGIEINSMHSSNQNLFNSIMQGTTATTNHAISFAKQTLAQYSAKLLAPNPINTNTSLNSFQQNIALVTSYLEGIKSSYAVEVRKQTKVLQGLNLLRLCLGLDALFPSLTMNETMLLLYLKMLLDELMVAEYPHYYQIVNQVPGHREKSTSTGAVSHEKSLHYELTTTVKYASLALLVIYERNAFEMQRLGKLQGMDLLFTNIETNYSDYEMQMTDKMSPLKKSVNSCLRRKPIYAVFGSTAASMDQQSTSYPRIFRKNEIVVVIRGDERLEKELLHQVHEYSEGFHNVPILFPPPKEVLLGLLSGVNIPIEEIIESLRTRQDLYSRDENTEEEVGYYYANYGMSVLALWIMKELGPSITRILSSLRHEEKSEHVNKKGYEITVIGHGLGGSIASLVTIMLHSVWDNLQSFDSSSEKLENVTKSLFRSGQLQCVSYGPLACLSSSPSALLLPNIISVVLQNDVFVALSYSSIRRIFHSEITSFYGQLFQPMFSSSRNNDFLVNISNEEEFWFQLLQKMLKYSPFYSRFAALANIADSSHSNQRKVEISKSNKTFPVKYEEEEDDDDLVMIDEPIPVLSVPGKVLYLYESMGQWKATSTSTIFEHLLLNRQMLVHHIPKDIFHALLECRAQHNTQSTHAPPYWLPIFSTTKCACCKKRFEWPSSEQSDMSKIITEQSDSNANILYRDEKDCVNYLTERFHCYHCGEIVCGGCNRTAVSIPKFSMIFPKRICDTCVLSGEYAQM